MAIEYNPTIQKEMLPVILRTIAVPDDSPIPSVHLYNFVQASDGRILTNTLPPSWAQYVRDCLNQGPIDKPETSNGTLLARIAIPGMPIDHWEGRTVGENEEGRLHIETTRDFTRAVTRAKKAMAKSRIKKNISTPLQMVCVFRLPTHSRLNLPNLIATAEKILFAVGVFAYKSYNVVKSVDGSEIIYTDKEDEIGTIIYLRTVEK